MHVHREPLWQTHEAWSRRAAGRHDAKAFVVTLKKALVEATPAPAEPKPQAAASPTATAAAPPTMPVAGEQRWDDQLAHWAEERLAEGADHLLDEAIPSLERVMIRAALARTDGHRQEAARLLGWGRNTLTRKIKELGMESEAV